MCNHLSAQGVSFWDERVKCCTYLPNLPNFLVGRVLLDEDPQAAEGRETVITRIKQGFAVTPWGLEQTHHFKLMYRQSGGFFGRAASFRCPHLLARGGCGIYKNRPGVCGTYYCKHTRGSIGQHFWKMLNHWYAQIEVGLGTWCATELGAPIPQQSWSPGMDVALELSELGAPLDKSQYDRRWGKWIGKEEQFYQDAASLIQNLTWSDVKDLLGAEAEKQANIIQEAYNDLVGNSLPERARVAPFQIVGALDGKLRVVAYSVNDPLLVSRRVIEALPFFDGRPVRDTLATVREQLGLEMDPKTVRRLLDFRLIESISAGNGASPDLFRVLP
jgi:Fe-S-cluster containining protein